MLTQKDIFGYQPDTSKHPLVVYLSMEYAIDQSLKIYSGGLGFLSGSHFRSMHELQLPTIGVGMLWKYGYYDQTRTHEGHMQSSFIEKNYSYLTDTGITFTVTVHNAPVHVKAWLLKPETFGSAPLFLLSTDLDENDELSKSISYHLYDANEMTRIAQSTVLGIGAGKLMEILNIQPALYHLNEAHGVALAFYLYSRNKDLEAVKRQLVFTTHTPEMAGNESHSYHLLDEMSFFYQSSGQEIKSLLKLDGDAFNYTLAALKFARKANGVSKMHSEVTRKMWSGNAGICEITSVTNAQSKNYWVDQVIDKAISAGDNAAIVARKKELKRELFKIVADQCGKLFNPEAITIVWARRLAGYKRADLFMRDWARFTALIGQTKHPVQIIVAGKPYPEDNSAISQFNYIISALKPFANCAVLTGYELTLSAALKKGADVWLNNPLMYHEASGTSGMTAAMNGAVNLTIPDGWIPEFARDGKNCFLIPTADESVSDEERDHIENANLMDQLEKVVLPMYFDDQNAWLTILKTAAADIVPQFDSARMVNEYYSRLYSA